MSFFRRIMQFPILVCIMVLLLSCCRKNPPQRIHKQPETIPTIARLVSPQPGKVFYCGDSVQIVYQLDNLALQIDSVTLYEGKNHAASKTGNPGNISWHTEKCRTGQTTLRFTLYYNDSLEESHNIPVVLLSDITPVDYKYRVVAKYNHDNQAYTQGLIYENGILYESTGLEGKSSVRIVEINTGKPQKYAALAPQYFGEGIALFKDQIYQVTYKSQVGFIYDKNTLNQIRTFDYQIAEGWGLTSNGEFLIMSDGSAQLFFIEPEYFTQVDRIQVFDHKGMIDSLNELEFIKGKILANVYGQTYIVVIDPATGKVTGKIELEALMPEGFKNDYSRVLNGIAYNPTNGHLYLTGKNWPVLYEVELIPAL